MSLTRTERDTIASRQSYSVDPEDEDQDGGPIGTGGEVEVADGDAETICVVRRPWNGLTARQTAELIARVLNDVEFGGE